MKPDAFIFDLDGTLWDTNATCAAAWNRVITRLGIEHREITAAELRAVAGQPHIECVHILFAGLPEASLQLLFEETQREDNLAVASDGGELYAGVREHVPLLAQRLPLMIVSNCQRGYIEAFLSWSRLGPHFADHECWGNTGRPKAENLRRIIERSGAQRPYFVGDTEGDREAATANRVPFVHASYGFGEVEACDHRLDRFSDLERLVEV